MPIHDWTRVRASTFHFFHQRWIQDIAAALNMGGLPPGYFAMSETVAEGPIPDVLALKSASPVPPGQPGGIAILDTPPRTKVVARGRDSAAAYARRADRIGIYLQQGELIAVVEIVSPGNKDSDHAVKTFARKMGSLLRRGIHLLVVDLFPPSARDPHGIHPVIWAPWAEPFTLPADKPLTLAAYTADDEPVAYVEPVAVGDSLMDMPLFLSPERYVPCPLEATYQQTWSVFPEPLRRPLLTPPGP